MQNLTECNIVLEISLLKWKMLSSFKRDREHFGETEEKKIHLLSVVTIRYNLVSYGDLRTALYL